MAAEPLPDQDEVPTAEIIASLSLATDLGMGLPFEHGLLSTVAAMRLAERLGVDEDIRFETYYGCLLFYVGCTADAEVNAELFQEGSLLEHFTPVMFGTPAQTMAGIARALTSSDSSASTRALRLARTLPKAARGHRDHLTALCQVAQMLSDRLGMPSSVRDLFNSLTERWDGKGEPSHLVGDQVPLALRIIHVARDATFQTLIGGEKHAAGVIRARAGHAFDPEVAHCLADHVGQTMATVAGSAWEATLDHEPSPRLVLRGPAIDEALTGMADFTDLVSPYLVGHSSGVAGIAEVAAERSGLPAHEIDATRRAALLHDIGRVAVHAGIWQKRGALTADEWERVRLHAYHSDRVLSRSPFLAALSPIASAHHERVDGSGYHRGATGADLTRAARLVAAADVYHASMEPRPHRTALSTDQAGDLLVGEARAGRLDGESVTAVLEAAGHRAVRRVLPAGLTQREGEVIGLLARGLQTKQIARAIGISVKTADHHVQNAYAKIGVSTRAAAALFAMRHGLVSWGELPMVARDRPS